MSATGPARDEPPSTLQAELLAAPVRVLVVDDAPWVRERLVERLLEHPGVAVVAAGSRAEALACLGAGTGAPAALAAARPDAVVIDLSLPDGSGLDVLAAARALDPPPLCVVLTMAADPETREACLARGADHFFGKGTQFEAAIAAVIHRAGRPTRVGDRARQALPQEVAPPRPRDGGPSAGRAAPELRLRGALLERAIEHAAETIVVTDAEGRIQYANPAFERTTGHAVGEVLGEHTRLMRSGAHDRAFYQAMWSELAAGRTWRGAFINRRKDGTLYREEATISGVLDERGEVAHYVAVKRDVSAEEELRQRLLMADKLEAVGRMTAGVVHDFNNMLTVIQSCGELLRLEQAPGSVAAADAENLLATARRAAALCRQLLAFSSGSRLEPEVLDPRDVLGECEPMLRALAGRRAEVRWELLADTPLVRIASIELQQAVMNLVVNAVRAVEVSGGRVTVRCGGVDLERPHRGDFGAVPEGRWACIEVDDDGPGIAPALLGRIFEPFFTTSGGTGLGLSTVYRIIDQAGGRVVVRSRPGEGSQFGLFLPPAGPGEGARRADGPGGRAS